MGDLEVTVEGDEWKKDCEKAFNKIAAKVTVKGFRKGKAPKALVEKEVSPAEKYYQAVDDHANEWMRKALEEKDLKPISQPRLDIKSVDDDKAVLVYTFAVYPEVKIDDYKGLKYDASFEAVTDEDVDKEIDKMRETYADEETVDGEAQNGDTVNIDYEGFKDDVAFEGGSAKGYNLVLGSGSFIPGFEDQLVGVKAGDEKDLHLSFPEDYHVDELKGAPVVFKVKVNEVKRKVLPEVDDDFAQDVNVKDVNTVDELKAFVRGRLEESRKNEAESRADNELMSQLSDKVEADIPDVMVEDEIQSDIQQLQAQLQQYGISLSNYLKMMKKTADDLKNDYRSEAEKTVRVRLALEQIAKQENLDVTDEDIEEEYKKIGEQYNLEADKVKDLVNKDLLINDIRNQKAYELVKDNAAKGE
jgi:trigger factor